jgi:hypothetical protein
MERVAAVRWTSPPPTSVDEELVAYDDGSAWLVVRCSRDGSPTIGTWSTMPSAADHVALRAAGDVLVDLLEPRGAPRTAETVRAAALSEPAATARFVAAPAKDGTVTLVALGEGTGPVRFELDPNTITVHLEKDGATVAWFDAPPPITGFITVDASGLGGLGRRAEIDPGAFGAITLDVPAMAPAPSWDTLSVGLSGWLAEGLPDERMPVRFRVRTGSVTADTW